MLEERAVRPALMMMIAIKHSYSCQQLCSDKLVSRQGGVPSELVHSFKHLCFYNIVT